MATKAKKQTSKPKATSKPKRDQFGLQAGTNTAKAAALFAKGSTMKRVKTATGSPQYNVLTWLEKQGHKVERKDGIITVTPKPA